jgi:hypothetical protein
VFATLADLSDWRQQFPMRKSREEFRSAAVKV